ncbi:hypothetical protein JCM5350_002684 [Sporobolomyces pararoseus]
MPRKARCVRVKSAPKEESPSEPPSTSKQLVPHPPIRYIRDRPPTFYPLKKPELIETMTVDEIDLGDQVSSQKFDLTTLEGLREWNAEHEALIEWLYDPRSRRLVDPNFPNEHARFLTEIAFRVRRDGKPALASNADALSSLLDSDRFSTRYVEPWLKLSKLEQEKLLFRVFLYLDTDETGTEFFSRGRKLVPELVVEDLLSDGGRGFVNLLDHLAANLPPRGKDLPESPLYNEKFFKKFGIPVVGDELPLSKADRAFHQEYLMRRHSLLFSSVRAILREIIGSPQPKRRAGIANYKSELTRGNDPELADKPRSMDDEKLAKGFKWLVDERCVTCDRTAFEAGLKQLLYCEKCKRIDRIEPYCSQDCQKEDWKEHKRNCGLRVSTTEDVEIVAPQSQSLHSVRPLAHLPPLRRSVRRSLESSNFADEIWVFSGGYAVGYLDPEDKKKTVRVRQAMRALSFKALETADPSSVSLLAYAMFNVQAEKLNCIKEGKRKKLGAIETDEKVSNAEQEDEFRRTFAIESKDWMSILKRGRIEIGKKENAGVKEFYYVMLEQACYQRDGIVDQYSSPSSPGEEKPPLAMVEMNKFMFEMLLGPIERVPLEESSDDDSAL